MTYYRITDSGIRMTENEVRSLLFDYTLEDLKGNKELILDNGTDFEDDFQNIRHAVYGSIEEVIKDLEVDYAIYFEKVPSKRELEREYIKHWSYVIKNNMNFNDKEDRDNIKGILKNIDNVKNMSYEQLEKAVKEFD